MSKSPRALQELMTAVDAGHEVDVYVDSASSDSRRKLLGPRRRPSTNYGREDTRNSAPAVAAVEAPPSDASFEFSAGAVSYSSASPASMVFTDGQLRAHQFPAVRSSADTSQATSPVRSSSTGSGYSSTSSKLQAAAVTGSKKRVSFAMDDADDKAAAAAGKAGGGQGMKKSGGGLMGCMSSACWPSSRNQAVEPVARNDNRKVVAV